MKLNDMTIKNLKPRKNAYYATNSTATRGYGKLAVKVNPGGQKHFYIQYRHDGRRKFLPLGAYPEMSLKEAGKRYDKYKQLIYDGIDPRESIRRMFHLLFFKIINKHITNMHL